MSDGPTVGWLGLLAAAAGLDTTAALQVMVSEPLVAATLAGLVVGDPALGLIIGASLELVWAGSLPVGAAPFPDAAPAAVAGVGGAWLLGRSGVEQGVALAAALLAALAAGLVGQRLTMWLRKRNDGLAALAEGRAARGDAGGVRNAVLLGLTTRFALSGALAAASMAALVAVRGPLGALAFRAGFAPAAWVAPVGACAVVLSARGRSERLLVGAGFAGGLLLLAAL